MLRVFGITYDHTVNYGSCFQAYALQNAVEGTILTDGAGCKYQLIPVRNCEDWPVQMSWKRILVLPFVKLHHQRFAEFESKNINFVPIRRIQDFPILNKDSDVFVCGSDVIWNPDENKNIEAFYLNFAEKYKFSYAASFGKAEVSETTKDFIRRNLITFNSLSVRESSGVDIINSCIDYPSPIRLVCDPVVLLKSVDWEKLIISNDPKVNNKYIFVYITHLSTSVQTFIKRLGQETGYKIVYAAYGPKQALKQGMLQVQTPEKWLQLLHDAEYVVTNSFHATVFSVLFHKKFFTANCKCKLDTRTVEI